MEEAFRCTSGCRGCRWQSGLTWCRVRPDEDHNRRGCGQHTGQGACRIRRQVARNPLGLADCRRTAEGLGYRHFPRSDQGQEARADSRRLLRGSPSPVESVAAKEVVGVIAEAGYDQMGAFVQDGDKWLGILLDSRTADGPPKGSATVIFLEVTKGKKPELIRDGC